MSNNYDAICAICGQEVNADTLYYCCPECHRKHRTQNNRDGNDTAKAAFISRSENLKEEATHSNTESKPSQA